MISVAQAQALIRDRAQPLPAEPVPLALSHGRILREPISSPEDIPHFDRSAMDGYVVRAGDPAHEWTVVGEIRAGQNIDADLQPGQAMRIFTGARLPGPGLKVIMQENIEADPPSIRLLKPSDDLHIRRRGEDARAGEILLAPGTALNAAAVGLLASVGKARVLVSPRPRILHLTTGDEIVAPDQPLRAGEIRNSNASLIAALVREWGGEVIHLHAPDRLEVMIERLAAAGPKNFDLILVSGGSGAGAYDFTGELFRHLGVEIHFQQVAVRPGKPLIFGSAATQLVFGLPGNALSHFVCFHLFVRLALARLQARDEDSPAAAFMAETLPATGNSRETWWPARTRLREGRVELIGQVWQSSGDITRLPAGDALIRVPPGMPELPAGSRVDYLSLRSQP